MRRGSSAGSKRRTLGAVALACALVGSPGCLTFEKETMVFVFPPGGKEMRGLLVYEGLGPGGANSDSLATAKEQLGEAFGRGERFYLGGWLFQVRLKPGANDDAPTRADKALLRKHLVVRGGGFFLNEGGRLCGCQFVTVRDREKFARDLNGLLSRRMADYAKAALADPRQRAGWEDEESLRLTQRACATKFEWVRVEPGRFSLTLPATPAATARLKRQFLGHDELAELRQAAAGQPGRKGTDAPPRVPTLPGVQAAVKAYSDQRLSLIDLLCDSPVSFDQRKGRFTVSLGVGEGEPLRLGAPVEVGPTRSPGEKDLIAHARTLKVPFKTGLTAEKLVADFLKEQAGEKKP
jgi:hypothetical protein